MNLGLQHYRCWSDMRQHLCPRCRCPVVTTLHGQFWLASGNDQVTFDEVVRVFGATYCFEAVVFRRHNRQRCTAVRQSLKELARENT